MSGRTAPAVAAGSLRVEVLKELQQLLDSREARDRVDRGPLAEAKGREHWVLHLLLRAQESSQAHLDTLVGSAYSNLLARVQQVDDRALHLEEQGAALSTDLRTRMDSVDQRLERRLDEGLGRIGETLANSLGDALGRILDDKWRPVGDSIETFAQGSKQMLKDVADTYRVGTQSRLLLNENARRISDLGRDLVALEETLKLVVTRAIEEGLAPLESRIANLEAHTGISGGGNGPTTPEKPGSNATVG